ncbi:hypothetical protein BCR37DRAFT_384177 [Protomyces lactucae-debilis]|uniref:Uncharacterized protein n=1 Tax=Protomyces lactucae-debilis TaxID=2754530 RepID=A0A1Y2EUC0_PROLT|nr:uncharacterized protein BCR37DRAFT_384177 [Protomyces lactucae-debilis]ORY75117.1 hypothetical protein BCR37DRAFT_384177 [Protomyces lactucae-debilis]
MKNTAAEGCPFIFIRLELEARKTRGRTHKRVRQETGPKSQRLWATSSQTREETRDVSDWSGENKRLEPEESKQLVEDAERVAP